MHSLKRREESTANYFILTYSEKGPNPLNENDVSCNGHFELFELLEKDAITKL